MSSSIWYSFHLFLLTCILNKGYNASLRYHAWIVSLMLVYLLCRVQALILSPTRELATQTEKVILAIGDYINVQAHACIGGKSIGEDIRKLEHGVHVVSGTPGRVCDMIKRRTLRTRAIKILILVSWSCLAHFEFISSRFYRYYSCNIPTGRVWWNVEQRF